VTIDRDAVRLVEASEPLPTLTTLGAGGTAPPTARSSSSPFGLPSATKTLPWLSTATPKGGVMALPSDLTVPLAARISLAASLPVSATKTLPAPSTATPCGALNPLPRLTIACARAAGTA
jgi:hypothetical protein